ncbi:MAG: HD domain-containing protein [Promethearchaeota archaeon]
MVNQYNFEEKLKIFSDKKTLDRAKSISDDCIRILKIDKENGIIEAEVQGNKLVPYKINFDISQKTLYNFINHDCPDYLARKKPNNRFCKHIVKFFYLLNKKDSALANWFLKEFDEKKVKLFQSNHIDFSDYNHFINKDLEKEINFDYKGFDFFFDLIELSDSTKEFLRDILKEAKKLPAALRGFHGGYIGGLFDHILLVTNYTFKLSNSMIDQIDLKKAVLTAIYHDFGKISYYSYRKKDFSSKIIVEREELDRVHEEIVRKFNYEGRHHHVEEAIAVLRKNKDILFYDDDIYKAIIFHHGQWSKYYPIEMNELANLVHEADMIASQKHFV